MCVYVCVCVYSMLCVCMCVHVYMCVGVCVCVCVCCKIQYTEHSSMCIRICKSYYPENLGSCHGHGVCVSVCMSVCVSVNSALSSHTAAQVTTIKHFVHFSVNY